MKYSRVLLVLLMFVMTAPVFAVDSAEGYYRSLLSVDCFENTTTLHVCQVEQGLNIKRRNNSSYYVSIHTEGNFGHFCSYKGIAHIENKILVSRGENCKVFIEVTKNEAEIHTDGSGCDSYCGANVNLAIGGLKKK